MPVDALVFVNLDVDNGAGHLLQLSPRGLCFVPSSSATVADWEKSLRAGAAIDAVTGGFTPIAWSSIAWLEWGDDLEIRFAYDAGSAGTHAMKYVTSSDEQRDEIVHYLETIDGFRKAERAETTLEIAKGPAQVIGGTVFLAGVLVWASGQTLHGGGRTAARIALFATIGNALGYGGIAALALLVIGGAGFHLARKLRNPPVRSRLERSADATDRHVERAVAQ